MMKIGTLLIDQIQYHRRSDKLFEIVPGTYDVHYVLNDDLAPGYMTEIEAYDVETADRVSIILGGGWYSRSPCEIPNFGLGSFQSCVEYLPTVGESTRLVCKVTDLQ